MKMVLAFSLSSMPLWIYFVLGVGLFVVICVLEDRRRKGRLRREHAELNRDMSDEEFVRVVGITPPESVAACRVRRAIAAAMAVSTGTLLPSDKWSYISQFIGFDGMDDIDIEIIVEKTLGIRISTKEWDEFWKREREGELAGLIRFLVTRKKLGET